ncbi:hypothetical protein CGJ03_14805 [Vibrio parahaemolyticus]|nr:hypothetical protein CGJ03_14805 [Vibrio parahaemolyticus]
MEFSAFFQLLDDVFSLFFVLNKNVQCGCCVCHGFISHYSGGASLPNTLVCAKHFSTLPILGHGLPQKHLAR